MTANTTAAPPNTAYDLSVLSEIEALELDALSALVAIKHKQDRAAADDDDVTISIPAEIADDAENVSEFEVRPWKKRKRKPRIMLAYDYESDDTTASAVTAIPTPPHASTVSDGTTMPTTLYTPEDIEVGTISFSLRYLHIMTSLLCTAI